MSERRVEKRNRPPVSCEPCRTRKLKCSRGAPCDTCVKRGKASICRYAPNADRSKTDVKRPPVADRLRRLEELIATLAEDGLSVVREQPPAQTASQPLADWDVPMKTTPDQAQHPQERQPVSVSQTGFADANHWSSILEDIRDIREQLAPDSDSAPDKASPASSGTPGVAASGFDFGFGHASSTFQEVLAGLPSRQVCDFLVAHYFQARFTTLPIIHPEDFQRQYDAFWEAGDRASPIWTALLFAMLALSAGTTPGHALGTETIPTVVELSARARQCLVLGNYTEAKEHVLEALLLHLQSYFLKGTDANTGLWFVSGMMLRLALRLGYHRDPARIRDDAAISGGPELTPFRAEMRRRVWTSIYQLDTLVSFLMGLPSMMPVAACDCGLPRNLEYSDFGPDTAELPPGRPISDHTTALETPSHEETAALDAMVRDALAGVPEILRARPIARSLVDDTSVIMRRITIEMLSLKTLIVLHRRHLDHDSDAGACASHQACLVAALQMLGRQVEMAEASRPGGRLYDDRWMISTLTANDLILASVVVCLDLTIRTRGRSCACHDVRAWGASPPVTLEMELAAVERAHGIWDAAGAYSAEARVAARALEGTIRRVTEHQSAQASAMPYEDMHRISFHDDAGLGMGLSDLDVAFEESSPNAYHWEFIDNWLLSKDEEMPDLGAWILESAREG